jgi:von Willebrand factor type A domain
VRNLCKRDVLFQAALEASMLPVVQSSSSSCKRASRARSLLPMLSLTVLLGCSSDGNETSNSPATEGDASGSAPVRDAGVDARAGNAHPDARVSVDPGANSGQADADVGNGTCDSLIIQAMPNAPEVLIVLDRSGSMIGNNATMTNRWEPSAAVLKKVTAQFDQVMQFGLMVFPDPSMGPSICAVGKINVAPALGTSATIATTIDASQPTMISATPTAATLEAALTALSKPPECTDFCAEPNKFVLLVTDGAPNCLMGGTQTTQADVDACDGNLDKLKAAGVTTYVIGYDTAKDPNVAKIMDGFASHGGTGKQLPVEDEKSLLDTMTSIAGKLVSCEYRLMHEVNNPAYVRVTVDGEQYDLGTGWTLGEDKKTITLGSACDKLRDAKVHDLRITLECDPVYVM